MEEKERGATATTRVSPRTDETTTAAIDMSGFSATCTTITNINVSNINAPIVKRPNKVLYSCIVRDDTLLVHAGDLACDDVRHTIRHLLEKRPARLGWDIYTSNVHGARKGIKFHIYQPRIDGSGDIDTWIYACVYNSKRTSRNTVQTFLMKLVILTETARQTTPSWRQGDVLACQEEYQPLLMQQMCQVRSLKTSLIVSSTMALARIMIMQNRKLLDKQKEKQEHDDAAQRSRVLPVTGRTAQKRAGRQVSLVSDSEQTVNMDSDRDEMTDNEDKTVSTTAHRLGGIHPMACSTLEQDLPVMDADQFPATRRDVVPSPRSTLVWGDDNQTQGALEREGNLSLKMPEEQDDDDDDDDPLLPPRFSFSRGPSAAGMSQSRSLENINTIDGNDEQRPLSPVLMMPPLESRQLDGMDVNSMPLPKTKDSKDDCVENVDSQSLREELQHLRLVVDEVVTQKHMLLTQHENNIQELEHKEKELSEVVKRLKETQSQKDNLKTELEEFQAARRSENERLEAELESENNSIRRELNRIREEKEAILSEKDILAAKHNRMVQLLQTSERELATQSEKLISMAARTNTDESKILQLEIELEQVRAQVLREKEENDRILQAERQVFQAKLDSLHISKHEAVKENEILSKKLEAETRNLQAKEIEIRDKTECLRKAMSTEKDEMASQVEKERKSLQDELMKLRQTTEEAISQKNELANQSAITVQNLRDELDELRNAMLRATKEHSQKIQEERRSFEVELDALHRAAEKAHEKKSILAERHARLVQGFESGQEVLVASEKREHRKIVEGMQKEVTELHEACDKFKNEARRAFELLESKEKQLESVELSLDTLRLEKKKLETQIIKQREDNASQSQAERLVSTREMDTLRQAKQKIEAEKESLASENLRVVGLLNAKELEISEMTQWLECSNTERDRLVAELNHVRTLAANDNDEIVTRADAERKSLQAEIQQLHHAKDQACSEMENLASQHVDAVLQWETREQELHMEMNELKDRLIQEKEAISKKAEFEQLLLQDRINSLKEASEESRRTNEVLATERALQLATLGERCDELLIEMEDLHQRISKQKKDHEAIVAEERTKMREQLSDVLIAKDKAITEKEALAKLLEQNEQKWESMVQQLQVQLEESQSAYQRENAEQLRQADKDLESLSAELEKVRQAKAETDAENERLTRQINESVKELSENKDEMTTQSERLVEARQLDVNSRMEYKERIVELTELHENELTCRFSTLKDSFASRDQAYDDCTLEAKLKDQQSETNNTRDKSTQAQTNPNETQAYVENARRVSSREAEGLECQDQGQIQEVKSLRKDIIKLNQQMADKDILIARLDKEIEDGKTRNSVLIQELTSKHSEAEVKHEEFLSSLRQEAVRTERQLCSQLVQLREQVESEQKDHEIRLKSVTHELDQTRKELLTSQEAVRENSILARHLDELHASYELVQEELSTRRNAMLKSEEKLEASEAALKQKDEKTMVELFQTSVQQKACNFHRDLESLRNQITTVELELRIERGTVQAQKAEKKEYQAEIEILNQRLGQLEGVDEMNAHLSSTIRDLQEEMNNYSAELCTNKNELEKARQQLKMQEKQARAQIETSLVSAETLVELQEKLVSEKQSNRALICRVKDLEAGMVSKKQELDTTTAKTLDKRDKKHGNPTHEVSRSPEPEEVYRSASNLARQLKYFDADQETEVEPSGIEDRTIGVDQASKSVETSLDNGEKECQMPRAVSSLSDARSLKASDQERFSDYTELPFNCTEKEHRVKSKTNEVALVITEADTEGAEELAKERVSSCARDDSSDYDEKERQVQPRDNEAISAILKTSSEDSEMPKRGDAGSVDGDERQQQGMSSGIDSVGIRSNPDVPGDEEFCGITTAHRLETDASTEDDSNILRNCELGKSRMGSNSVASGSVYSVVGEPETNKERKLELGSDVFATKYDKEDEANLVDDDSSPCSWGVQTKSKEAIVLDVPGVEADVVDYTGIKENVGVKDEMHCFWGFLPWVKVAPEKKEDKGVDRNDGASSKDSHQSQQNEDNEDATPVVVEASGAEASKKEMDLVQNDLIGVHDSEEQVDVWNDKRQEESSSPPCFFLAAFFKPKESLLL